MARLAAGLLRAWLCLQGVGSSAAGPPALLLPLRRATLPAVAAAAYRSQRRTLLGANASAQLELYGSVRDNGVFTVHVQLGTPAQDFDVIVDTGSTLAYVPCQDCGEGCGRHEVRPKRCRPLSETLTLTSTPSFGRTTPPPFTASPVIRLPAPTSRLGAKLVRPRSVSSSCLPLTSAQAPAPTSGRMRSRARRSAGWCRTRWRWGRR